MAVMAFTKEQPKYGDTIMHCGHPDRGALHWFQYENPIKFSRPDGTHGLAEWFAACERCFIRHGAKVSSFVRGDDVWTGNEPTIEKVEN
jgi:hypothetical protein